MPKLKNTNTAVVCDKIKVQQLVDLILAYWTPERLAVWAEYEKTDKSVPWREFERQNNNKEVQTCQTR